MEEAGPAPQSPTYEEMRADMLGAQSAVMTRFLKETALKNGTTLFDRFERYAEMKFKEQQQRNSDALGTYRGPNLEQWKARTVAAKAKSMRALANEIDAEPPHPERDTDYQYGE